MQASLKIGLTRCRTDHDRGIHALCFAHLSHYPM